MATGAGRGRVAFRQSRARLYRSRFSQAPRMQSVGYVQQPVCVQAVGERWHAVPTSPAHMEAPGTADSLPACAQRPCFSGHLPS